MRTSLRRAPAAALAVLLIGSAAPAQESGLAHVPASAPLVIQLNGLDRAKQRLGKLLGNAVPDHAPKAMQALDEALGALLDGRDPKAVTKNAHIFYAIMDLPSISADPELAVVVPVTGYKDFVDSFLKEAERKSIKKEDGYDGVTVEGKDEPMCLIDRTSHVVIAKSPEIAKLFAKKDGSLEKAMSEETRKAFLGSDAAVYVSLKQVNDDFGETLKGYKAFLDLAIQAGGAGQGIDKKQLEMIKNAFNGIFQVLEDGAGAVAAFEFRPEGLYFRLQAQFRGDTTTAGFLKGLKPNALNELTTLPAGHMSYTAMRLDPKISRSLSAFVGTLTADDEDEKAKKAIEEALKELVDAGMESHFSVANLPPSGLEIAQFKDPAKAVQANLNLYKALTKDSVFESVPVKEKPEVKEGAETVGAFKLNLARFKFDIDKAVAELPEELREATKASMTRMMGEEMRIWFGTDGKRFLQVTAKDWKAARTLVEDYLKAQSSLANDEAFQLTRKNLPAEATMLILLDAGRSFAEMFSLMRDTLQTIPGIPGGGLPEIRKPDGKPVYMGMAVVLKPEHGSFDLFVPTTSAQQIRKMISPLLELGD